MLGAATFVIPCGREHEGGAVETPASRTQLEVSRAEREPTAEQLAQTAAETEEDEHSVNHKPPAQKSIQEVQELDQDDEGLRKYREALLGRVAVPADRSVPDVVVTRRTLVCSTAPGPLELDLAGDLESSRKRSFVLKEGVEYGIKTAFRVNREVMSGVKYIQRTYGKGGRTDETDHVVGRYGPGRGVRVPDSAGGGAQRHAGSRPLQHQVPLHRRRQDRPPALGVEPHHQEGVEGLTPCQEAGGRTDGQTDVSHPTPPPPQTKALTGPGPHRHHSPGQPPAGPSLLLPPSPQAPASSVVSCRCCFRLCWGGEGAPTQASTSPSVFLKVPPLS
nr:rho GDP-dissociation inhibitor 1-like [Vicugna pacos]